MVSFFLWHKTYLLNINLVFPKLLYVFATVILIEVLRNLFLIYYFSLNIELR